MGEGGTMRSLVANLASANLFTIDHESGETRLRIEQNLHHESERSFPLPILQRAHAGRPSVRGHSVRQRVRGGDLRQGKRLRYRRHQRDRQENRGTAQEQPPPQEDGVIREFPVPSLLPTDMVDTNGPATPSSAVSSRISSTKDPSKTASSSAREPPR